SPATRIADTSRRRCHIIPNVAKTVINSGASQTRDAGHQTNATASERSGFQSDKSASALFIQNRSDLPISLACGAGLRSANHLPTLRRPIPHCESLPCLSSPSVAGLTQLFPDRPLGSNGVSERFRSLSGFFCFFGLRIDGLHRLG